MSKRMKISWLKEPENKDYSAAELYLTLVFERPVATKLVSRLRKVAVSHYIARDVLRAAAASILGMSDSDDERKRILQGPGLLRCCPSDPAWACIGCQKCRFQISVSGQASVGVGFANQPG
jgi:hypothetical protein